ncbi:hypothetical protein HHL22_09305 [Hymenobacter sp. RP-2-7]|uniref:Uncharacterized protein n=1 Tax=Hymenobacter polaris TaxID=2682546 RepID=A0A7Y0FMG6_9BACT|nr:hypothetical protein [Hymenobacter polaris]NML65399.1 hypothetical protein [Hymenobacter polaris]
MLYRVLYLVSSADLHLLEIQRLNLPATAPNSEVYQWLHYVPASNQLTPLTFVSMHSAPPFEERQFKQGELRFSNIEGIFQPAGTRQAIALQRDFLFELPPLLAEQLSQQL